MKKESIKNLCIFIPFVAFLGFVSGTIVWATLRIMSVGIDIVWEYIPEFFGNSKAYTIAVCIIGSLIVGLYRKKHGDIPEDMETVMYKVKRDGTYEYNRVHILIVGALLPLIFGASVGPEAGLTGVIVGICYWVGDQLRYKKEELSELANVGMAAALVAVFGTPFLGLAANYEMEKKEKYTEVKETTIKTKLENHKKVEAEKNEMDESGKREKSHKQRNILKTIIYVFGVLGSFLALMLWNDVFGGGTGLPRFASDVRIEMTDFLYILPLVLAGLVAGFFILFVKYYVKKISVKIEKYKVISCLTCGVILGVVGAFLPLTMFSGEHQFGELMTEWIEYTPYYLIFIGFIKIVMTILCINLGLKGGEFFPMIFSTACIGFALAGVFGITTAFATGVVIATALGVTMRKPPMVIGILILCFPIKLMLPVIIAAFIGSIFANKVSGRLKNVKAIQVHGH